MKHIEKKPREYQLPLRMDEEEKRLLTLLAQEWGVTLASALRRLIREAPMKKEIEDYGR